MTTKTDITLLPCPCCGAPAVTGADAEYENSNGDPAVECSVCNVMAWTVEDWNRRAAVEADRQRRMPSDEEIEEFCAAYADEMGCIHDDTHVDLIRAALSRYSSGQSAASAEPLVRTDQGQPCPHCGAGPYYYCAHPFRDAAPVAAQAQPVVNQQMTTDTALADTQRAIIEAAERRGYARAEAENVGYRTDAGRYRFIRLLTGDRLDAAIDAARAAKGGE